MVFEKPLRLLSGSPAIPRRLLLGPGPSNAPERVLKALSAPLLGHLHPEFLKIMDDVKEGLKYFFQTKNAEVVCCISGTGHAGMEAAIGNLLERGDNLLIGKNGIWGERAQDMASRLGIGTNFISKVPGQGFTLEELEEVVRTNRPNALFLTHAESSTGVLQPLPGVGNLCHKYDTLLIVDTVASLGGAPFYMDEWEVDVVYTGTQKVLGAPPSLAPIAFSKRAMKKINERTTPIPSFYFDVKHLANYWGCDDGPRRYHHTGPISSIYALREALAVACEEGLENLWKRHQESATLLHEGVEKLGVDLFVEDPEFRTPTITTLKVPHLVDWKKVTQRLIESYNIEISGGLGPTAGKVWRIGLMGINSTQDNVKKVLTSLEKVLKDEGVNLSRI